jgi:excisionase family DNA binding protein
MPGIATVAELEPLALAPAAAARYLAISKRSLSRLIADGKIAARKHGPRTLVDVGSLKAYYASLPQKGEHPPIAFGRRAHVLLRSRMQGLQ